jgi:putative transposase
MRKTPGVPVWQRNYYERIIRNQRELDAVRRCVRDNPGQGENDDENLDRR